MSKIVAALEAMAADKYRSQWQTPAWKQYVLSGDRKYLKALEMVVFGRFGTAYLPSELQQALPSPGATDVEGRRLIEGFVAAGFWSGVAAWLVSSVAEQPPRDEFDAGRECLEQAGCRPARIADTTLVGHVPLVKGDGTPTSAGRFLAALPVDVWIEYSGMREYRESVPAPLGTLLARHAPAMLTDLLDHMRGSEHERRFGAEFWCGVIDGNAPAFASLALRTAISLTALYARLAVLGRLAEFDPDTYGTAAEQVGIEVLLERGDKSGYVLWCEARDAAIWLVRHRHDSALPALKQYFAAPLQERKWERDGQAGYKVEALEAAVQALGMRGVPLLEACFVTDQGAVQVAALKHWVGLGSEVRLDALTDCVRKGLAGSDGAAIARLLRLLAVPQVQALETDLWPMLGHKSRPVRDAVATALAKLGENRIARAADLWRAKRADARMATAAWLQALGTPTALAELQARYDNEDDDNVRDALLLAIEKVGGATAGADRAEIARRIARAGAKIAGSPAGWLDPKRLPAVKLKDGGPLGPEALRYLLHRQSRVKEMRADIEARPLFEALDRSTSGDLGLAVVHAFFGSKMEADDRWALAFAALVGDDRLVPVLTRQLREWADASRGKLAEYAVQALALLGTQAALLAINALAIRYRSKYKNIGKAATEAFADAARARGLTPDELGDEVVPWLGFEPGKPRLVEAGKARIEVRIAPDLKFTFRDAATGKRLSKLPDSTPTGVKAEFKELGVTLKEAVKSQILRLENLMVRQFRWPVARWRSLYLSHPLLAPFAQRLVWGAYTSDGRLTGVFRALEDGSLTDAQDAPFDLAETAVSGIGVVHPLEISAEQRADWLRHLADYEVTPPFAQLDRPVVTVQPEDREQKFSAVVSGTELNALTFKGRAERLGWTRGSVCDAGGIGFYLKTFPTAGVDVFAGVEGMFIGAGMDDCITLGNAFFVRSGSVKIGSYEYDEPADNTDPRLVALGSVPAIAFSEGMGDLVRIGAKSAAVEEE
jgi:hypothetical protein